MTPETEALIRGALRGIAQVKAGEFGLNLSRLPDSTAMYHDSDPMTQKVADCASGARISLSTVATQITLTYRSTRDVQTDGSWISGPSVVTLTGAGNPQSASADNGRLRLWNGETHVRTTTGEDSVASFELEPNTPADEPRTVDLWLPHKCAIEIVNLTANAPMTLAASTAPKWVHYGSSISHASEADEPIGVWPVVAARNLGLDLYSLGLAGSANIEYFAAQVIAQAPADFITLKLGINTVNGNHLSRRVFIPAVHSFIDAIRTAHPTTPIVVFSPIFCPAHENNPGPTLGGLNGVIASVPDRDEPWVGNLTLAMIRQHLQEIVIRRQDPNLHYISGLELFGEADLDLMPDQLHPDAQGQKLMGERATALLKTFLP